MEDIADKDVRLNSQAGQHQGGCNDHQSQHERSLRYSSE